MTTGDWAAVLVGIAAVLLAALELPKSAARPKVFAAVGLLLVLAVGIGAVSYFSGRDQSRSEDDGRPPTTSSVATPTPTSEPERPPGPATVAITSHTDGTLVETPINIGGTCTNIPADHLVWVVSQAPDGSLYPQYESVAESAKCVNSTWTSPDIYVSRYEDNRNETGERFTYLAVLVDRGTADQFLTLRSDYSSISALPAAAVEFDRVTVLRR
ncbi:MAG: hypothetical protein ACRDRK_12145 [Pseudonocardia sp.]